MPARYTLGGTPMVTRTGTPQEIHTAGAPITAEAYERLALGDSNVQWELHRGRLVEKPGMSVEHGDLMFELAYMLRVQLDRADFRLRVNAPRLRRSVRNYYIPDVPVIPTALERPLRGRPGSLEIYDAPLPLVVEVWSPSTGTYDVNAKLADYQRRGDAEIWRIHPYQRTLTAWRRQPDGNYVDAILTGGAIQPVALPNVTIDLDALFLDEERETPPP